MPKFLTSDVNYIPMSGATIDLSSGVFAVPTGTSVSDMETLVVDGVSTAMSGEIKFIHSSGTLVLASGTGAWMNIDLS
jgi:hypothetical protein